MKQYVLNLLRQLEFLSQSLSQVPMVRHFEIIAKSSAKYMLIQIGLLLLCSCSHSKSKRRSEHISDHRM